MAMHHPFTAPMLEDEDKMLDRQGRLPRPRL